MGSHGRVVLAVALLAASPLSGCLGIDNMGDLKDRLGFGPSEPEAPVAVATAEPTTALPGATVRFSAAGSRDPDGGTLTYRWGFGDGGTAEGADAEHAYDAAGDYTVTLTVRNEDGLTGTATVAVLVVENLPPEVQLAVTDGAGAATTTAVAGEALTFSAEGSRDPEGTMLTFQWDFGDGGRADGARATHAYASAGRYTARVTATDADGKTSDGSRILAVNHRASAEGSVEAPDDAAEHAFPVGAEAVLIDVVVSFDASLGANDLQLRLVDGEGAPVGEAATMTEPGAMGTVEERMTLTRDALATFAAGEWKAVVVRAAGVQVAYDIAMSVDY